MIWKAKSWTRITSNQGINACWNIQLQHSHLIWSFYHQDDTNRLQGVDGMADHLTKEHRSWNMAQIKGKDTHPEVLVRSMLHRAGYRFRKNVKELPGKPDIVLPKYRTVIFVHGCFWHRHRGCKDATTPKTNQAFWKNKFERNMENDRKHARELKKLEWSVTTIWECELKNPEKVLLKLEEIFATKSAKKAVAKPSALHLS